MGKETMQFEFNTSFKNITKVNPLFSTCDIRVMYTGENRNKSSMSKPVVNNALPSLYNIPIVGEFLEEKEDFDGHGGKLEIDGSEIKYVHTTKPIGLVPESATTYWESVEEENGTINEYLVVEGAYLWTGRYEEAESIVKDSKGQSMEIVINNGNFNNDDIYIIEDFTFSALCVLGDDVEPCFESANITGYSLDKDSFKQQFKQMVAELKFSLDKDDLGDVNKEGGRNKMGKENNKDSKFSLSSGQLTNEFNRILMADFEEDDYGFKRFNYFYVDHNDNYVVAQSRKDDFRLVGIKYNFEGDVPQLDFESKQIFKVEYSPVEGGEAGGDFNFKANEIVDYELQVKEKEVEKELKEDFAVLKEDAVKEVQLDLDSVKSEYETLKSEFEDIKTEKEKLEEFKVDKLKEERANAEESLYNQFDSQLSNEEISEVKEKASEMSLEQLESHLYMLVGKKAYKNFSNEKNSNGSDKIYVDFNKDKDNDEKDYYDLIRKHNK